MSFLLFLLLFQPLSLVPVLLFLVLFLLVARTLVALAFVIPGNPGAPAGGGSGASGASCVVLNGEFGATGSPGGALRGRRGGGSKPFVPGRTDIGAPPKTDMPAPAYCACGSMSVSLIGFRASLKRALGTFSWNPFFRLNAHNLPLLSGADPV